MDPSAALRELRELVTRQLNGEHLRPAEIDRVAELFDGLDGWLSRGGFLPEAWRGNR